MESPIAQCQAILVKDNSKIKNHFETKHRMNLEAAETESGNCEPKLVLMELYGKGKKLRALSIYMKTSGAYHQTTYRNMSVI